MQKDLFALSEDLTPAETDEIIADLKRALLPPSPVPDHSLQVLYEAACHDSGGSQAARNFLFWLAGKPDPTGFEGSGGLELRRLDRKLKSAALEVLTWWAGPTKSDEPFYAVLRKLRDRFASDPISQPGRASGREVGGETGRPDGAKC